MREQWEGKLEELEERIMNLESKLGSQGNALLPYEGLQHLSTPVNAIEAGF